MSEHLEQDLKRLQHDIKALAAEAERAVTKSIRALKERDAALAQEVIAGDNVIDEHECQIEDECLKMIVLHQPVAVDLRRIAAVLKINTDLERMGDLAVDIAERAVALVKLPPLPVPEKLQHMTDLATFMVRESLDAFFRLDVALARRVWRLDDEVDRLDREITDELIATMHASPVLIEPAVSLFSVSRHLERIADHATNIAEDVIYLARGEIVRHRAEAFAGDTES